MRRVRSVLRTECSDLAGGLAMLDRQDPLKLRYYTQGMVLIGFCLYNLSLNYAIDCLVTARHFSWKWEVYVQHLSHF